MLPPGRVTGYDMVCHLVDVWASASDQWKQQFVIMRSPDWLGVSDEVKLVYVDIVSGEWGPLMGPGHSQWQVPPYGFPALFFIPLSSGAVCWIRHEKKDELSLCYREGTDRNKWNRRLVAFRAAPSRGYVHAPLTFAIITIGMFHSYADGNCYLPLVQDCLSLYDAARGKKVAKLPQIALAFKELEKRLLDTFHCRQSQMRASLRGSLFQFEGFGYGHFMGVGPGAIAGITRTAVRYGVPLDIVLLGCVTCAMARADNSDFCDYTLYAPMRDGAEEAMAVGLFSDWRDLYVSVDFDLATVIGTILQLQHKLKHRQWSPFNVLRKPERTVINIQPLDFEKRAGFKNLGENMWRDANMLNHKEPRANMDEKKQPAMFDIRQQDKDNWWVLANVAAERRPPEWMRKFEASFQDAMTAFLFAPLTKVHVPLPVDDTLLYFAQQNDKNLKNGPINLKPGEMNSNFRDLAGYVKVAAPKPDVPKPDTPTPEAPELDAWACNTKAKAAR